jgi:hypothetical protein
MEMEERDLFKHCFFVARVVPFPITAARHEALQRANNASHPGEFVPEPEAIPRERLRANCQPPTWLEVKPIPISRRREQLAHMRARNCELVGNLGKRNRAGCAVRRYLQAAERLHQDVVSYAGTWVMTE